MWYREGRGGGSWQNAWEDFVSCSGPDWPEWAEAEFQARVRDLAYQETGEQRGAGWLKEMTLDHLESLLAMSQGGWTAADVERNSRIRGGE